MPTFLGGKEQNLCDRMYLPFIIIKVNLYSTLHHHKSEAQCALYKKKERKKSTQTLIMNVDLKPNKQTNKIIVCPYSVATHVK